MPRWVDAFSEDGEIFASAIAFTIDADSELYAGNLPAKAVVKRLATATGGWGSSADHLFQTHRSLRGSGIIDPEIERLVTEVKAIRSEAATTA